jgi:hypothetical protein
MLGPRTVAWREPLIRVPVLARDDRLSVIVTAAFTSAGVSLLTMWLWSPGLPAGNEAVAVAESRKRAEAPVRQGLPAPQEGRVRQETPVDAPILVAAAREPSGAHDIVRATDAYGPSPLIVITEPAGARVTINGVGWGTTPLTIRHLPPGAKRVRVTKAGYQSVERVVDATADRGGATLRLALRQVSDLRAVR